MLFCRMAFSYFLMRSRSSCSGGTRLRLLGVFFAGVHGARDFKQFLHGKLRSHLILRCWQSTQESIRFRFSTPGCCSGAEDMVVLEEGLVGI